MVSSPSLASAPADELADAGWFLDGLDAAASQATLVRADRARLSAQPFLDEKWPRQDLPWVTLPFARLAAANLPKPRVNFIWHSSYCASTLLASALDAPGVCLSLKEPSALVDLADIKGRNGGRLPDPALGRAVFALLGRRFDENEAVLIKASNGANTLIGEAAAFTEGRMLLLYSGLERFLLSMARAGQDGAQYVRELFLSLAGAGHPVGRWRPNDLFRLTDLQLSALVWRMQMDILQVASERLGERARSLDCRHLLDDPGPTLRALDRFFGIGLGRAGVERALASPLLTRDAKAPHQPFDAEARADEDRRRLAEMTPSIEAVRGWLAQVYPAEPKMARPLERAGAGEGRDAGRQARSG